MPPTRYTIHTGPHGYTISREGDPNNHLRVPDLSELLRLRTRLNQFVEDQQDDGADAEPEVPPPAAEPIMLSVGDAISLAARRGRTLPSSTFRSACQRGDIRGAWRHGARWRVPADAYELWLESWIRHTEKDA